MTDEVIAPPLSTSGRFIVDVAAGGSAWPG